MNIGTYASDEKPLIIIPAAFLAIFAVSILTAVNPYAARIVLWAFIWVLILSFFLSKFPAYERRFLIPFVLLGIIIRMTLAIFFRIDYADSGGLITPDEFYYFDYSGDITDAWMSGLFLSLDDIHNMVGTRNYGYHIYDALHFMILEDKLLPVISNIFLDILTSLIVFKFTVKNFGDKLGKLAFLLIIFNPYLIYWSTFNLKDSLLTFLTALIIYTVDRSKKKLLYVFVITLLMILLASLRFYLTFIFVFLLVAMTSLNKEFKFHYRFLIGFTIVISVLLLYFYTPLKDTFHELMSEGIHTSYQSYTTRSFEVAQDTDYTTQHISGHDPKSLVFSSMHALFAPSPLNLEGDGKYLVLGTLFWYFLIPYSIIGTLILIKSRRLGMINLLLVLFPLIMLTIMILMPAINEPRHRLVALPCVTILAALGIASKYRYKNAIVFITLVVILAVVVGKEVLI
jgi:hypothetical protein